MTDVVIVQQPEIINVESGTAESVVVEVGVQGPPGSPGSSGNGSAILQAFAWGDVSPAKIIDVPAGKTVFKVEVILSTPFDGVAILTVGDGLDSSRLFSADNIDLTLPGTYQTNPGQVYAGITAINLYLTLGSGVSSGNGLILIYIQE